MIEVISHVTAVLPDFEFRLLGLLLSCHQSVVRRYESERIWRPDWASNWSLTTIFWYLDKLDMFDPSETDKVLKLIDDNMTLAFLSPNKDIRRAAERRLKQNGLQKQKDD